MDLSPLQKARYEYSPKLPQMLRHPIEEIEAKEGKATESVSDQEEIKKLFPNTYGMKEVSFQKGTSHAKKRKEVVGVILSGGQAPGGHNVITGLFDALKSASEDNVLIGANAVVIEGCRIGHDAVVAAGAIVVSDVEPNTVVAGCPARVIKVKDEKTAGKTALVDALRTL